MTRSVTYRVARWLHEHGVHALCRTRREVTRTRIVEWPAYVLPDGTLFRPDLNGINGWSYPEYRVWHEPWR